VVGSASPEGFKDTPMLPGTKWHVHDPDRPLPPVVTPGKTFSHEAPAPSDAVVLFDGKDLSKWPPLISQSEVLYILGILSTNIPFSHWRVP